MNLSHLHDILSHGGVLPDLTDLQQLLGQDVFLVGGTLRDWLLGRPVSDFDFASPVDPVPLAQAFARRIGGHWFFLDEKRRQCRVTVPRGEGGLTYDFVPFRAPDLTGDLRLRDFTINALALPLHFGAGEDLIDPLNGLGDLAARRLRACSAGVFTDDPLRVLKGVRHAAVLGFELEEETSALMRAAAPGLAQIAPERIRAEIGAIFLAAPAASSLYLMRNLNCLEFLFGPGDHESAFEDGVRLTERCEEILRLLPADPQEASLLSEEVEGGISRGAMLKLAAFGHAYVGAGIAGWGERLKLSRRTDSIMRALAVLDPRRTEEMEHLPPGRPRAVWAAGLGRRPLEALIFLAVLASGEPDELAEAVRPVLRDYFHFLIKGRVPDLIDGKQVRESFGLASGPAVGEALAALRHEEEAGRVRTPEEGWKFLNLLVKKDIDIP